MKLSAIAAIVLMLTTLATANMALAGIDDSFDWKGQKRKLKVFYDFDAANDKLGDKKMKDIMDEAIKNWNDAKADTGWEFVSGGTSADHDIRIKVDDNLNRGGGASTTGFPAKGDKNREVSELTITFDPTPQANGTKFDWDTAGKNKDDTKNPVSNAKHELSHTLRLDHQGGTRSETKKIKDPQGKVTKNDDVTTISQDDKDEAKKASTVPIKVASAPAGPGTSVLLAVSGFPMEIPIPVITPDAKLSIPGSAFLNDALVSFSRTSLYSMPVPFDTPSDVDRMVKGAHIDVTGLSQQPPLLTNSLFTLTIPYEDGVEGDGFLIDIADPDYGSIIESTLRPFIYDPLSAIWKSIDPFALGGSYFLDTANDFARISLPSNLLYSFPNLDDLNTGTLFISISGTPVPEPSTLFLLGSGLAAMFRSKTRRRCDTRARMSGNKM